MRNVTWLLLFSFIGLNTSAQGVFSNQTNAALQKVIEDYPNNFRNIKGDRISTSEKIADYKSKVQVPGSITCVLTQDGSGKAVYSWKCELFETGDFDKAKSKFSELYNQIHNTIIKMEGEKPFILNGKYEVPGKERYFTNVIFHLLPSPEIMQKLKVELTLQYESSEWKIALNVYEQAGHGDFAAESGN
jgi:hypothetical protein